MSSRSHGFFCVEVKKRVRGRRKHGAEPAWSGSALTIVDLAGSERAREAKTAGTTLAEAGKINESLMYLGQCLQMQSDAAKDKVRKQVVGRVNQGTSKPDKILAKPRPVPAVQINRIALLQLLPFPVGRLLRKTQESTEGRHDRHGRSPR